MRKVLFISLGCDKNLADSEEMLGMLVTHGYEITNDETEANVAIINTCAFIHDAKEESIANILEMARYKEEGQLKVLLITGCLAQRYKEEIVNEIPEVDAVLGTTSFDDLLEAIDQAFGGERYLEFKDISYTPQVETKRMITTGGHFEYLKIAEGCDKHCTYCIIPKLRGNYRSVPMEKLLNQARYLAEQGVKELILVAQETTVYGVDLYGEKSLHKLLKELCKIPGIAWIRVLYCYPEEIYPELIQVMKEESKICHYLDLPIQHASDAILKRMGRRTTKAELKEIVGTLRREIPDIVLRTTLITGFPGETPENHEELMEFIDEMEFDRLGVFTYSAEEDTPAASMPEQVDEEVKNERMKTELVTNVSHDLRTPLTAIITYIDLLKNEKDEEKRKEYTEVLERKSLRLKALIEDLFEMSKAASKTIQMNYMKVDLVGLIRQAELENEEKIREAHLEFRWKLPEDKVVLWLDSEKTYRIFENLIVNITKYAMPHTRVYIEMNERPDDVQIFMKNVSAGELNFNTEEITDRFVRGDSSRNTEGSGLGLAIAKSFAQLQHGNLNITTEADLFKAEIILPKLEMSEKKED